MSAEKTVDVIIIGGGMGGCAAALRAVQNGMQAVLFAGSKKSHKRSRSQWVVNLDNMIGFHEDIIKNQVVKSLKGGSFDEAADHIDGQHYHINNRMIIKNTMERLTEEYADQITIVDDDATELKQSDDIFAVAMQAESFNAPAVVLATGIMDEQPHFDIRDRHGDIVSSPRPIYPYSNRETALYCIRCEGHLTRNDPVAVIGSTEVATYVALMLHERYENPVFVLGNGTEPQRDEDTRVLCKLYGITTIADPITHFTSADLGELSGVQFENHDPIEVRFAFINMGTHRAYNDLARQVGAKLVDEVESPDTSQVLIDYRGETSVHGLFVVGDLAWRTDEPMMKQVYTAQEYAVRAMDSIDHRRRTTVRMSRLRGVEQ